MENLTGLETLYFYFCVNFNHEIQNPNTSTTTAKVVLFKPKNRFHVKSRRHKNFFPHSVQIWAARLGINNLENSGFFCHSDFYVKTNLGHFESPKNCHFDQL